MQKKMRIKNLKVGAGSVEITAKNVPIDLNKEKMNKELIKYDEKIIYVSMIGTMIVCLVNIGVLRLTSSEQLSMFLLPCMLIPPIIGIAKRFKVSKAKTLIKDKNAEVKVKDIKTNEVCSIDK